MEDLSTTTNKTLLSPEPKRITFTFPATQKTNAINYSVYEDSEKDYVSELSLLLYQKNFPVSESGFSMSSSSCITCPVRNYKNPMISDEKFIMIEYDFSTASEDSGSDSERSLESL